MFLSLIYVLHSIVTFGDATSCQEVAATAARDDGSTVVETDYKLLAGTWSSEGCETRPGPEYVLRYYQFEEDGRVVLTQHHYWDDSCSSSQMTIHAHGKLMMRTSMVQPGAAAGNLKFVNITVVPQDDNAAKELDRRVMSECPGQTFKTWRKYDETTVYDAKYDQNKNRFILHLSTFRNYNQYSINSRGTNILISDISCLGSLKYTFNEMKLLKIQLRPIKRSPREAKMELLLGDIHSNPRLRQYYTPTSFQSPLVKQVKEPTEVKLDRHLFSIKNSQILPMNLFSKSKAPPHLIQKPHLPPYIWGHWSSLRCESRPGGTLFLTRKFIFEESNWMGQHNFYSDPLCRIPKFVVTAFGHFRLGNQSSILKMANNIDFDVERASLTVLDQKMIADMQLNGHCGRDDWEVNVPQELLTSRGCIQMGLILPSVQFDVVKLEMDYKGLCLLYLGQVDTENYQSNEQSRRPTAYQPPLVKCGDDDNYSKELWNVFSDDESYLNGALKLQFNYLILSVWLLI